MYGDLNFFSGLSFFGWIGVLVWIAIPIAIYLKQDWFFNYERRKPKLPQFSEYCYTFERQVIFMVIRFCVMVMFALGVGKLLTMI